MERRNSFDRTTLGVVFWTFEFAINDLSVSLIDNISHRLVGVDFQRSVRTAMDGRTADVSQWIVSWP